MKIIIILKLITALGIFNVWVLRFNKMTEYRGGSAKSLKEEFEVYGLKLWTMYLIGAIKIIVSILFIISFIMKDAYILDELISLYGSATMSLIMFGAILMHVKNQDPIKKSFPAITMLTMYSIIFFYYI